MKECFKEGETNSSGEWGLKITLQIYTLLNLDRIYNPITYNVYCVLFDFSCCIAWIGAASTTLNRNVDGRTSVARNMTLLQALCKCTISLEVKSAEFLS